jgi:chemotaxis protein MotB
MRRRRSADKPGSPLWMTTYADMVTNLLALFVLLYAFSELDVQRFQSIITSFQAHAGVLSGSLVVGEPDARVVPTDRRGRDEIVLLLEQWVHRENLAGAVEIVPSQEGVTLSFIDRVLFDSGKADLRPDSRRILASLGELLSGLDNQVRIEGHTDNVPISNAQFPSNWELSVYRASTVVRFLEDAAVISSERLSAVGYGEYRPVMPNKTAAERRRNRRVDVIVLVDVSDALPTEATQTKREDDT